MNNQRVLAVLLVALMIPLSGCVSDGSDGAQGEQGVQGPSGSDGTNGIDGIDGINGTNGTDGQNGSDGASGINGKNSMISTFDVLPGIQCENGGIGVLVGIDENNNGLLTSNEVTQTSFVCNGLNGTNSGQSSTGFLSEVTTLGKSTGCPAGGKIMMFGLDNGDGEATAGNGVLEFGEIDEKTTYCSTQRITRISDIAAGNMSSHPGYNGMQVVVDDTLYFNAHDGVHGSELWAYDMTLDTARLVSDINIGPDGSLPGYWLVVVHDDVIYFDADDGLNGRELWAHDTLTGSSWLVADLNFEPGYGSNPGDDIEIIYGDTLYFSAFTLTYGTELWAHHPANNSTWLVEDIHHGSSANPGWYMNFVYNDVLYFTARDIQNVHDLWAHNQSNGSTWKVASFGMAPYTHPGSNMEYLIGDTVYFDADNDLNGRELMAYNLKTDVAWVVADIAPGQAAGNPGIHMSILMDDTIYFDAFDQGLWAHSTTNYTTWKVHQFTGAVPTNSAAPVRIGNEFFFKINDGSTVVELWAHNTDNGSTWMVENYPIPANVNNGDTGTIEDVNGILYFDAITEENRRELWAHDPVDDSTWLIANLHKADALTGSSDGSSTPGFTLSVIHNGYYYFSADDGMHGNELWKMWFEHTITYE